LILRAPSLVLFAAISSLGACVTPAVTPAAPAATTASPAEPPLRARDLYPLAVGHAWTYESVSGGVSEQVTVRVLRESGGYFVDSNGGALRHDATGLRDPNRYLLREPLVAGTKWTSVQSLQSSESYEVVEADRPCTVPAGTFARCVRVRGATRLDEKRSLVSTWTYAEGVGLVELRTSLESAGQPPKPQVEARLVKFTPAP